MRVEETKKNMRKMEMLMRTFALTFSFLPLPLHSAVAVEHCRRNIGSTFTFRLGFRLTTVELRNGPAVETDQVVEIRSVVRKSSLATYQDLVCLVDVGSDCPSDGGGSVAV